MTWTVYSCLAGSSYQVPGILQTYITHLKRTVLMTCTLPNGPSKEYTEILERKAVGQTLPGTGSFGALVQRRHICLFFNVRYPKTLLDYPPPQKKNTTHTHTRKKTLAMYSTCTGHDLCVLYVPLTLRYICRMKLYVY